MHAVSKSPLTLGRYTVIKHLASGGMADVLLARTNGIEGFERHVVIKRIRAEVARDQRFVAMFLDEARLAASLHHHNIVGVHDVGQAHGEYFFAMEYLHGEDARRLLMEVSGKGARIPIEHVITIATAAAAGLHHAHEQRGPDRKPLGVVHRDVSPANIMIGYDGSVKVADFGIAKAEHRSTETRTGTLKGKVAYMSPEQCVGEHVDRRSDVFSLGIVLYELVTTRRLFKGDNDFLTMSSIVLGYIPPPSSYRPDLPPELEAIILKALASKRDDRYATADELRVALEQFANAAGLSRSSTSLADYLKAVFGDRPEPWLVEEDEPEVEMTVDFDGSASGIVQAPQSAIQRFPTAGRPSDAPIIRARTKAITATPAAAAMALESTTLLPTDQIAPGDPIAPTPAIEVASASAVTIVPVAPHEPSESAPIVQAPRRRTWLVAVGAAVVVLGAAIAIVASGGSEAAAVPAPQAVRPPPRAIAPTAVAAPAPIAAPAPAPAAIVVAPAPAPVVTRPAPVLPKRAVAPAKPKTAAPKSEKHWDPNALFPE